MQEKETKEKKSEGWTIIINCALILVICIAVAFLCYLLSMKWVLSATVESQAVVIESLSAEVDVLTSTVESDETTTTDTRSAAERAAEIENRDDPQYAKNHDQWKSPESTQEICCIKIIELAPLEISKYATTSIGGYDAFFTWLSGDDRRWYTKYDSSSDIMYLMCMMDEPMVNGNSENYSFEFILYPDNSWRLAKLSVGLKMFSGDVAQDIFKWYVRRFDTYMANPENTDYWIASRCPEDPDDPFPGGVDFPEAELIKKDEEEE